MYKNIKTCVKYLFRLFGLNITCAPKFEPYEWLKEKNIKTIFDIGANTGQFAWQFHRLFPDAEIYSFEPLKNCYNEMLKRMENVQKFHAFNFALGDKTGKAEIHHNDYSPSSSLLPMEELHKKAFPFTEKVNIEEIDIRCLDDIAGHLDLKDDVLVKIDVQGFEDKVILGGGTLISRASVLILETSFRPLYKGQLLFDDIYEMLKKKGFVYSGTEHTIRNPNDGSILQCDSIFCKENVRN